MDLAHSGTELPSTDLQLSPRSFMVSTQQVLGENMYTEACDCNTTAMGPCWAVMHAQYHGLCVSVLGVCVEGRAYGTCVYVCLV